MLSNLWLHDIIFWFYEYSLNVHKKFCLILLRIKIFSKIFDYFFFLSFPQTNAELYKYLTVGIRQITRGKLHNK
jgi:hypothetical protein